MALVDKQKLISQIVAKLEGELLGLNQAVKTAYEAATHEENKAEDQHDTRGLEASYLAGAQAARAMELEQLLSFFRTYPAGELEPRISVGPGSLVELDRDGKRMLYFLVTQGGGTSVQIESRSVQVVSFRAPMGEALLGKKSGEEVELETPTGSREYTVISVG